MAISTAAALLGSAVIGAGASALNSKSAINSAKDSSQYATDQTIAFNNKALDLQQQNTQPYRDAGALGTQALLEKLGLVQPKAQAAAGSPDWDAYIAANPDLAASISGPNADQWAGSTPEEKAADHYARYGKAAGWELPTVQAKDNTQPKVLPAEANTTPGLDPNRPNLVATPAYQPSAITATPAYQAPTISPLDVSLAAYQKDPGYDWQQKEASRATLAGSAATGALRSGAAAKALQDRAQQIANTDYSNWRNYTTSQYNTDRNYLAQQSQFGYNALQDNNQFTTAAEQQNSQFGYNALTGQNNMTNQYNQQGFNTDRAYTADQNQQGTNNLFTLTGLGASAAGSANSAIGANASNNSNALFSNAASQGNAALAGAGQVNNAINTGTNALAYYLGNKKVA